VQRKTTHGTAGYRKWTDESQRKLGAFTLTRLKERDVPQKSRNRGFVVCRVITVTCRTRCERLQSMTDYDGARRGAARRGVNTA